MSKQSNGGGPSNFSSNVSSKVGAQRQVKDSPGRQQQPRASATAPALPAEAVYNPSTGHVTSGLMTQVVQQPPPQRQHSQQQQQQQQVQQQQHQRRGQSGDAQQQQQQQQQQQRVHASALIERARLIRNQPKNTSPIDASAHPSLLPPPHPVMRGKKCLILDVDETLVHSSYQNTSRYDVHLAIPLEDQTVVNVYVAFRPHLAEFLEAVAPLFEVVIFTASLSRYCIPLMDSIDAAGILGGLRLFREHCSLVSSTFVKDLSLLGRQLDQVAIIDNSPVAYLFQQRNAIPILSWFDDPDDTELLRLIPVLGALAEADTVYDVLDNYNALLQLQQQAAEFDQQQHHQQ